MMHENKIAWIGIFTRCFLFASACLPFGPLWGWANDSIAASFDRASLAEEQTDILRDGCIQSSKNHQALDSLKFLSPIRTNEISRKIQDFYNDATQLLNLYTPKMRYPYLSVSMRADDPPTIEMHRIAVDVAALAYHMVDNKIWLPQSDKFLPFLGLTVESMFQREFHASPERENGAEESLSFNYDEMLKDYPVVFYFSNKGKKSISLLLDEFSRKERFDVSTDILKYSNIERRLRCVSLIAAILLNESGYQMKDPTPDIAPETWHQIARETWREISRRMADDDDKFKEGATVAFNSRMPFYLAFWAYPPDPVKYPRIKRSEKEYERIMKYVPDL